METTTELRDTVTSLITARNLEMEMAARAAIDAAINKIVNLLESLERGSACVWIRVEPVSKPARVIREIREIVGIPLKPMAATLRDGGEFAVDANHVDRVAEILRDAGVQFVESPRDMPALALAGVAFPRTARPQISRWSLKASHSNVEIRQGQRIQVIKALRDLDFSLSLRAAVGIADSGGVVQVDPSHNVRSQDFANRVQALRDWGWACELVMA